MKEVENSIFTQKTQKTKQNSDLIVTVSVVIILNVRKIIALFWVRGSMFLNTVSSSIRLEMNFSQLKLFKNVR